MTRTSVAGSGAAQVGVPTSDAVTHNAAVTTPAPLEKAPTDSAATVFSQSVMISGIRCLLAYIVFPWVLPALGIAKGVGPWIGITVGVVAIGFNLASIRRFWAADHRWKWPITLINCSVIGLLVTLLVIDAGSL